MPQRKQGRHANASIMASICASAVASTYEYVRAGHRASDDQKSEACKYFSHVSHPVRMRVQDTVALLNKDLTAAQEKLLQAEHLSNKRLDELEAARSQLQVNVPLV